MRLPRRVLHVMNGAAGGAAMSTIDIMRGLREEYGIDSVAVCHPAGSAHEREALLDATAGRVLFRPLYWWNLKNRAPRYRRPLIEAKQLLRTGGAGKSTWDVVRFARQHEVDLVHSNTILTIEGALASRAARLAHVWHLRELLGSGNPFRFLYEGPRWGAMVERLAEQVVANSKTAARTVSSWLSPGRLTVAENAIEVERFGSLSRPDRDELVVGMIGNLASRTKNHRLFLEAAARVEGVHARFVVYGQHSGERPDDAYERSLRELSQRNDLRGRVEFAGFVADPVDIFRHVDVLVHPSGQESFGRIAAEALAAGVPVVGIDRGGVADIVQSGDTGILVPGEDPDAMAHAIRSLLLDEAQRTVMGKRGREVARARYALPRLWAELASIYAVALGLVWEAGR